ncbi:hypothetical protein HYT02_05725 [Candidatus Gottesmanbacteria bacterium]|nr:hypothetical protein [Candidatus Gottesmanbacteria bacterium]
MRNSTKAGLCLMGIVLAGCTSSYFAGRETECAANLRRDANYVCKEELDEGRSDYKHEIDGWNFPGIGIYGLFNLIKN